MLRRNQPPSLNLPWPLRSEVAVAPGRCRRNLASLIWLKRENDHWDARSPLQRSLSCPNGHSRRYDCGLGKASLWSESRPSVNHNRQTLKPKACSISRPSVVMRSGPHGGSQTQLMRMEVTMPSRA